MGKYSTFIALVVVMFCVSLFGSAAGFTVNGVEIATPALAEAPGVWGVSEWVWSSLQWLFYMVTFQVDGTPAWLSAVLIGLVLLLVFQIVSLIRGVS